MIRQRAEARPDFDHPIVGVKFKRADDLVDHASFVEKMLAKALAGEVLQSVRFRSTHQFDGKIDGGEHAADVDLPGAG